MKVLFDTSVLVAALVRSHQFHPNAIAALRRVQNAQDTGWVAMHSIAELYSVLTRLPIKPRIVPTTAWQVIQRDVLALFKIVALSPDDYATVIQQLSEHDLPGGIVYDALIIQAARKINVDNILTLNKKDFIKIAPDWADRMSEF